jgi:hypothetical protein
VEKIGGKKIKISSNASVICCVVLLLQVKKIGGKTTKNKQ